MKLFLPTSEKFLVKDRNVIAAALSIFPGAGQIYKGHYSSGLILFFGMPLAVVAGMLLSLATGGLGLVLPLLYWAWAGIDAYHEDDLRKHHWLGIF